MYERTGWHSRKYKFLKRDKIHSLFEAPGFFRRWISLRNNNIKVSPRRFGLPFGLTSFGLISFGLISFGLISFGLIGRVSVEPPAADYCTHRWVKGLLMIGHLGRLLVCV
jgi:hypothetical protein